MTRARKKAILVTGEGFMIRVLFPRQRLGVGKAREASEVFKLHGARTTILPESRTMVVELLRSDSLAQINADLAYLGLRLAHTQNMAATYEWQAMTPKKRTEAVK